MPISNKTTARKHIKAISSDKKLNDGGELQLEATMAMHNQKEAAIIRDSYDYRYSAARYINNAAKICTYAYCPGTSYNMTCYKITREDTTAVYAYLYTDKDRYHQYVCCGPTFKSQDGEYRSRLLRWDQFVRVKTQYSSIFDQVEAMISDKLQRGKIILHVEFTTSDVTFKEFINTSRVAIHLLCAAWIVDFSRIHLGTAENHINAAYQYIIYDKADIPLYDKLVAELGGKFEYGTLGYNLKHYNATTGWKDINVECGQKMFSMARRDIKLRPIDKPDIMSPLWREIYANYLVSDITLNMMSTSFPIFVGWTVISNTHAGMYDNQAMHEKYERSRSIEAILAQLRAIADSSAKFEYVAQLLQNTISYAETAIKLTEYTLVAVIENIGRTVRDLPSLILKSSIKEFNIFATHDIFCKHMFEWTYAVYCLNMQGMMHSDLHLNNVTVNLRWSPRDRDVSKYRTVYIIEGEQWCVPFTLTSACIIDMSRVIFGDMVKIESDFGSLYVEQFAVEQIDRISRAIAYNFPKFAKKYMTAIYAKLVTNFELVFKALTALDVYSISTNLAFMATQDPDFINGNITITGESAALLTKLANRAEKLTLGLLENIIEGKIKHAGEFDWPVLTLLREHFAIYRKVKLNGYKYDILYARSKLPYSVLSRDTYGPLLQKPSGVESDIHSVDYSKFHCEQMTLEHVRTNLN